MTKGVVVKTLAAPAPPSTHAGGGASARKTSSLPSHWRRALARPGRRRHPPGLHHHAQRVRSARGAATAELAMVLPLLVAVTTGLVWLLAVASAQVRTVDAARETARALARGDDQATAVARGLAVAPEGSHVAVSRGRGEVRVTVTGRAEGPGGLFAHLPSPRLRAEAVAADEQDEVTP